MESRWRLRNVMTVAILCMALGVIYKVQAYGALIRHGIQSSSNENTAIACHPDFSGKWALDRDRTTEVPPWLMSYILFVRQSGEKLRVRTKLKDNRKSGARLGGLQFPGGGGHPSEDGPILMPGGGAPGIPGRGGEPVVISRCGRAGSGSLMHMSPFRLNLPNGTYLLDGRKTIVKLPGRMRGTAIVFANWTENGNGINLSVDRKVETYANEVTIKSIETWTLSEGGKVLNVKCAVTTPHGMNSVKMVFKLSTK